MTGPADSNRDNEYLVTIRAYNGSTYGSLDVTVTVTDLKTSRIRWSLAAIP